MSRLKKRYHEEIKDVLRKKFDYKNQMLIPALEKVIISMGVAEAVKDKNVMQDCVKELALISGQKPIVTKAKISIANFKLREGQEVGLKVTLRGVRMFDFFDRFCNIVCPRIRDFRGFKRKGDRRGSFSLGLQDQQMFPELNLDEVKRDQGMNITFVTSAKNDEECIELLTQLGLPFTR
ncbi:MAG: 50S ribosomal protein L5 [Chlamydiae bacterium]|nr:50S ribosomal protein L5 [Chlamydiota bacterium]